MVQVEMTKEQLEQMFAEQQEELAVLRAREDSKEWNDYDGSSEGTPTLLSEYEQKAFLISPNAKKKLTNSVDLLTKEISLSYLDNETAFIYGNKLTASEEWFSLGFKSLAHRRQIHLLIKLGLKKSVDGFERLLQTAIAQAQIDLNPDGQGVLPSLHHEQNSGSSGYGGIQNPFKFSNAKSALRE